jgi:molybdopterin synthase sulfur carrier subunit
MSVIMRIPTPFQELTGGKEEVQTAPDTIIGLIDQLERLYPGMRERLTVGGRIRGYINIFLNEDDIRSLQAEDTQVRDGDEVTIIPAISGGSSSCSDLCADMEAFTKKSLKLVFPHNLIREPGIFTIAANYDIMPNIRRARVTDMVGEIVLDLEGSEENIEKALLSMRSRGVEVEDITAAGK